MNSERARLAAALGLAAFVLVAVAVGRGGEYDEFYSIFLIAGDPRPAWPSAPETVGALASFYHGHASLGAIAANLRLGDVHPPLYFWLLSAWRDGVGIGLLRLRLLSVMLTLAALMILARIARRIGIAAPLAVIVTVLCYGFAYTGIVVRNFALADALSLAGILLMIGADRRGDRLRALLGGVALGAACFSNYLASFTTIAGLIWMMAMNGNRRSLGGASIVGAALFIPAGAWFFLAQSGSRQGQFHHFHMINALGEIARDQIGAVLGALPRYAAHPWSPVLEAILGLFAGYLLIVVMRAGFSRLAPRYRTLVAAVIVAQPLGLLALGVLFDTMPIEMRYFWLGLPYIGLVLASGLRDRPRSAALLLAVQVAAIIGLAIAPQTMQPAGRTARLAALQAETDTLVLVPFGNDGVGIPGPFIAMSPATMNVLVVRRGATGLKRATERFAHLDIAAIEVDAASRALVPRLEALFRSSPCWHERPSPRAIRRFNNLCRKQHA